MKFGVYHHSLLSFYCLSTLRLLEISHDLDHFSQLLRRGRGDEENPRGGTYSVLPLFFEPVFKFSDLLFKALNPSCELGRCQILVFVIIGPQGGAPSPARDTLESASPEGGRSDEDGRGGCNWSPCSWIKEIWLPIDFVISALCVPAIKWVDLL